MLMLLKNWKKVKGSCPKNKTGKPFTQFPAAPPTNSLLLQCRDYQMTCTRQNLDVSSTYPICCTREDGSGYPGLMVNVIVQFVSLCVKKSYCTSIAILPRLAMH